MAVAQVTIIPPGTKTASISTYVTKAVKVLSRKPEVKYMLTPMGTIIEGDLEHIFAAAKQMHSVTFDGNVTRVLTAITIDDRRDKPLSMKGKVRSVEEKLKTQR